MVHDYRSVIKQCINLKEQLIDGNVEATYKWKPLRDICISNIVRTFGTYDIVNSNFLSFLAHNRMFVNCIELLLAE